MEFGRNGHREDVPHFENIHNFSYFIMNNFSWSVDMSAQISGIVREESPNNYKHVVMTMIGSVAELGFHSVSIRAKITRSVLLVCPDFEHRNLRRHIGVETPFYSGISIRNLYNPDQNAVS